MLKQTLTHHLTSHSAKRYLIGYSGGRDSHVLLDCLYQLRQTGQLTVPIVAIHINHCLQKASDDWAAHCQRICEDYGIELITETVTTHPNVGESIEAFAREQRYALIEKHVGDGDIFLSAHHQRDQAETFLLQLMRGAGLHGLQAMPTIKPFGAGQYLRPLLNVGYEEIIAYAEQQSLHFIDDDSNADTRFNRNFIRHEVLPVLKQRFPNVEQSIARSATWLGEVPTPNVPDTLHLPTLRHCSLGEQKQQIRDYCKAKIGQALSKTQTDYIVKHHLTAAADKQPQLNVGDYVIRRFNAELVVTAVLPHVDTKIIPIFQTVAGSASPFCKGGLECCHSAACVSEDVLSLRHVSDAVCLPLLQRGIEGDLQPKAVDCSDSLVNPATGKSPLAPLYERGELELCESDLYERGGLELRNSDLYEKGGLEFCHSAACVSEDVLSSRHVSDAVCLPLSQRGIEGDLQPKAVDCSDSLVNPATGKSPLTPLYERGELELCESDLYEKRGLGLCKSDFCEKGGLECCHSAACVSEDVLSLRHVSDAVCLPLLQRGIEGDLQPKAVDCSDSLVNPATGKSPLTPLYERGELELCESDLYEKRGLEISGSVGCAHVCSGFGRGHSSRYQSNRSLSEVEGNCTVGTDYTLFLPHVENGRNTSDKIPFGKLTWQTGQGGLPIKNYQLKPLSGSMRFHPHTRTHSSTVKKLLHEAGIAPWLRPLWLGLFDGETLVAIPNVGVAKTIFQKSENAVLPIWKVEQKFVKL